ncbi:hypothetical protein ACP2W0_19245 [Pseudobacillus badius]|uniref:hypothetical protein n=1 Tax=Bacillus badius TaxID=1455 RepID=UPI003CEB2BED
MVGSGEFRSGRQGKMIGKSLAEGRTNGKKLPAEHQLIESGEGKINMQQRLNDDTAITIA